MNEQMKEQTSDPSDTGGASIPFQFSKPLCSVSALRLCQFGFLCPRFPTTLCFPGRGSFPTGGCVDYVMVSPPHGPGLWECRRAEAGASCASVSPQ